MGLAKVQYVKSARKAQGSCENCGVKIEVGDSYRHFAVGFRGFKRVRCTKPECTPTRAERESSLVSSIYDAQDSADFSECQSTDDINNVMEGIKAACEEVASQYEENPTFDNNNDLQERVDQINSAAESLDDWESSIDDEPTKDGDWNGKEDGKPFEEAHADWLDEAREAAQSAVNEMELP